MEIPTRRSLMSAIGLCAALGLAGCNDADKPAAQAEQAQNDAAAVESAAAGLETELQQSSYLLGYRQMEGLEQQTRGVVDMDAFLQGARDYVDQAPNQVADIDEMQLRMALQSAMQAKQQEASAEVRAEGDAFRAEYAAQEGVVELPSGLLYEVITEGEGDQPAATDSVTTHYHGTLIDGTVFDSSVERGEPATFSLNQVIPGWTEALQLMSVGSKWRLVLPPELAYGERGAGADIPPGATLMFEVELLGIEE